VEDFAETNWTIDARITDSQMMDMINEEFGLSYDRPRVCRIRNKGRVQLLHPEVMTMFPAEQNDDAEAADIPVNDDAPVTGAGPRRDRDLVIGAAVVAQAWLGATPWLVFTGERRREIMPAHPDLNSREATAKVGELWRALSADERAEYAAKAAPKPKVGGRGRGATGRPKKK
jgi:hypothetical protein